MARIIKTTDPFPSDVMGQLAIYSGMDNLTLFEINDGLDGLLNETKRATYVFEMKLQAALLEMSFNGMLVDAGKKQELIRKEEQDLSRVHKILHQFCEAIGYYDYYLDQTLIRFSDKVGIPVEDLPRSWAEWTARPVQWRREIKKISPSALLDYHKGLKTFGPPYVPGDRKAWTRKKNGAFNGNSTDHKLRLFYDFFGHIGNATHKAMSPEFPPPWNKTRGISEYRARNQDNEFTPTTNREALESFENRALDHDSRDAHYWALPFVRCCLDIADSAKTLGFLRCKLEEGYFKSSFGAVTDTGRLNSKKNAQGFGWNAQNVTPPLRVIFTAESGRKLGAIDYEQIESRNVGAICYKLFGADRYLNATECLTSDHEVLTQCGWVSIAEQPEEIACWSPYDHSISFQRPLRWVHKKNHTTYEINTKTYSIKATAKHKAVYWGGHRYDRLKTRSFSSAFTMRNNRTPTSGYYVGGSVHKPTAYRLLAAYQADGTINKNKLVEFSFCKQRKIDRLLSLLYELEIPYTTSVFPAYSNQTGPTTRFYIRQDAWPLEIRKYADNFIFDLDEETLTAYVEEHEFWDGHRENKKGYRITSKNKRHLEWLSTAAHLCGKIASCPMPDHDSWRISIQNRDRTDIGTPYGSRRKIEELVDTFCPTTFSGFFLYRRKGHIAISGNCGDLHTLVCSLVWTDLPWPSEFTLDHLRKHGPFPRDIVKAAKKIANVKFYRHFSRRDLVKRLGHGCLTADHEVLTPIGWRPIHEKPEYIMQANGTFAPVSNWIDREFTGTFVEWVGQSISVNMTSDHRVYYSTTKVGELTVKPAIGVPKSAKVLLGNGFIGGGICETKAKLYAAYHCDGWHNGYNSVKFHFHKQRKKNRIKTLAVEAGIKWRERGNHIILRWCPTLHSPEWSMLDWDEESLRAYMEELPYWDGHFGKTSVSLHTKHRSWAEKWQTFNRLLGYGGNIQKPQISGFGTTMHTLQINNRQLANRVSFTHDRVYHETAQVYCPTVPQRAFYIRRHGKISVTGHSNYRGQPRHMSKQTHIELPLVEHFQETYFEAFPELPKWHRWVAEQIQTTGIITTLLGRERKFFGRPTDDATLRKAIAFEPQSIGADYTNRALLEIFKASRSGLPVRLLFQKHDEIGFSFLEEDEEVVVPAVCAIMEQRMTITDPQGNERKWSIPVEAQVGWNFGHRSDYDKDGNKLLVPKNPDGLIEFVGHDSRNRQHQPNNFLDWRL